MVQIPVLFNGLPFLFNGQPITWGTNNETAGPTLVGGDGRVYPYGEPTSVQNIIPMYLYEEYADDEDVQSLVDGYNAYAQGYLTYLNNLNLPTYTKLSGALLDWVATNLYGLERPTLANFGTETLGPLNTAAMNTIAINALKLGAPASYQVASDDLYQRCLTWLFYKGDGTASTIPWLRRRIFRFLNGTNGAAPPVDPLAPISIAANGSRALKVTISKSPIATQLVQLIAQGALSMPITTSFTFDLT